MYVSMLNAIRLVRQQPPCIFSTPLLPLRRSISSPKLRQASATNDSNGHPQEVEEEYQDMEQFQTKKPKENIEDAMSQSFGEGYSTRSDDEGFGGIYGGNHSFPERVSKKEKDGKIHENHPECDKSQGSEVAEKERGRCQKTA